jgi:hypothetical protein
MMSTAKLSIVLPPGLQNEAQQAAKNDHGLSGDDPHASPTHRQIGVAIDDEAVHQLQRPGQRCHPDDCGDLCRAGAALGHVGGNSDVEEAQGDALRHIEQEYREHS